MENPVDLIWRGKEKSAADWLTAIQGRKKRGERVGDRLHGEIVTKQISTRESHSVQRLERKNSILYMIV